MVSLGANGSYIEFNSASFGSSGPSSLNILAETTSAGATISVYVDSYGGTKIATLYPNGNGTFSAVSNSCYPKPTGVHNLYVGVSGPIEIQTLQFSQ